MQPNSFGETVELLRRAREGDQASLHRVLERYQERLLTRIRLLLGDHARRHAESADFLQGVFLEILEGFEGARLADERAFLRWAVAIARNNIRDSARRHHEQALESFAERTGLLLDASGSGPLSQAERTERLQALVEALAALEPHQRQVLELRHFEGLGFAEIGRRTGRTESAARVGHGRALLRLGELLEDGREW